jgi:hypothetical protein
MTQDHANGLASALCNDFEQLRYCIAAARRDSPPLNASLDVALSPTAPTGVVIVGGTTDPAIRECAIEVLARSEVRLGDDAPLTIEIAASSKPAPGVTSVTGRLAPEIIKRLIRSQFSRFRRCYETALKSNPSLAGSVSVRYIVDEWGRVANAEVTDASTLPDPSVRECVRQVYSKIYYPIPEGGRVMVTYPIDFQNQE